MRFHSVLTSDVANGVGVRVVVFVSGCHHHCPGCQNPQTWAFDSGQLFDEAMFDSVLDAVDRPQIDGITFSGGDPLAPENQPEIQRVAERVKNLGKSVWAYTGYDFEEVKDASVMKFIDVLVDGKFILSERNIARGYRGGSNNQRVIDVQKSLSENHVVLHPCMEGWCNAAEN